MYILILKPTLFTLQSSNIVNPIVTLGRICGLLLASRNTSAIMSISCNASTLVSPHTSFFLYFYN